MTIPENINVNTRVFALASLRLHPLNRIVARLAPGTPEWEELKDDLRVRGLQEFMRVTADGQVVDGWTRREALLAIGASEITCRVIDDGDALEVFREKLVLQKRLSPSQAAFLFAPMIKPLVEENKRRRMENLKKGSDSPAKPERLFGKHGGNLEFLAKHHGFHKDLYRQAIEVHALFDGDPSALRLHKIPEGVTGQQLREEWLPKLMRLESSDDNGKQINKPLTLGEILRGIGGQAATKDAERGVDEDTQLDLFTSGLRGLDTVFNCKRWEKMDPAAREEMAGKAVEGSAKWSPAGCAVLVRSLALRLEPSVRRELAEELLKVA